MIGRVVSIKMMKTATVIVTSVGKHPLYKKTFTKSKKYLADDQVGVKLGDIVEMESIRPMSKNKHFRIVKVIGRDIEEIVEQELKEAAKEVIEEVMPESQGEAEEEKTEEKEEEKAK